VSPRSAAGCGEAVGCGGRKEGDRIHGPSPPPPERRGKAAGGDSDAAAAAVSAA